MLYLSPICKEIALSNCTESYCISTNTKIYRLTATIETQECSTTTCISFSTEASCMTFINQFNTIILVFKTSTLQHMATWQFHKSDRQDTEEEVSLCLVRGCGTHYHWLSVMYHWHWLSSTHDWRLFCFQEPTGHHHSASVTVSAVKFAQTQIYLLTYLLTP